MEMIPLCVPNLSGREAHYLQECVESTFVSSVGPFVTKFEEVIAESIEVKTVTAVSSGTTGLHLALMTLGVERDDLVVLPSLTFIASANAIAHCGALPWLMDVSADSWTLDPDHLRRALEIQTERRNGETFHKATGRRVKAVMPVYVMGQPADMDPIVEIAREFGLVVVADAAAALGATYKGRPLGDLGANLTVISFNGNKTVTAGGGGAVGGNEIAIVDLARHISTTARCGSGYDHDQIGYNYRLTNLQAAVGCAQMERVDELVAQKRAISRRYREALSGIPGIGFFPNPDWANSACWFSGITLDQKKLPAVDVVVARLRERGVDGRSFWKPIHMQAPYLSAPREATPISDAVWGGILTLPCSSGLSHHDQSRVVAALKQALDT
jgi:perosamine synthetase